MQHTSFTVISYRPVHQLHLSLNYWIF